MEFVVNKWIKPGVIERRLYQENIARTALSGNTLCVIPTGMGKTSIAALVAAGRLQKDMHRKIMFLAPTKPLVEQHRTSFERFLRIGTDELKAVTGSDKPEERSELYQKADIVFSTPQTIENDMKEGRMDLCNFSLCIFDEAHRSIGNYAYTYVAKKYMQQAADPLILALTASPGSHKLKLDEIKNRLFIKNIEIRSREDPDVRPYIQSLSQEYVNVELPIPFKSIKVYLEKAKEQRIKKLMSWGIIKRSMITKTEILRLQQELAKKKTGIGYAAMSQLADILKIDHALLLLETQSLYSLKKYLDSVALKAGETRSNARLLKDRDFSAASRLACELVAEGQEHPKIQKLKDIIANELQVDRETRIIVFSQFRDTITKLMEELSTIKHAAPVEFIGQAKKRGKGLSQKEQVHILNEFKMGFYNILIASQIGEEGLDIVETNTVIFYEPVPSAVRLVQRIGRTARTRPGKVIVMMTKDTRDEVYHWVGHRKEKHMKKLLTGMQQQQKSDDLYKFSI
jgi:Fanconi anemia group M protein